MAFSAELGLILLFSILGGVLAVRFRQPSVLGLILIGAIVGPYNLGFIKDASLIHTSIEIGAILLLFTVGIEFSLQHLLNLGLRVLIIAVLKLGIVFLLSYYTSFLLGFDFVTSLYLGVILSITSTVIVIKILDQKGMSKREELPLLIAVLIIEDIFGVFALTFFSGLNTRVDLSPLNLFTRLVISLALMALSYIVLRRILSRLISWLVKYSTEDTITFTSLGLCGGMSYLALLLNLSPSVGAFLAGNIVASLPNSKAFEKAIHPFILTFTSLFFFSIGTIVNFSAITGSAYIIIILFLVNILAKFLSIGFGSYIFTNFTGRHAVFSGVAMLSVGEFSLLIAKEAGSLNLGIDLVSITAAVIFLSSIAMSVLIGHYGRIYDFTLSIVPGRVREDMKLTSKYLNNISWAMIKDRVSAQKIAREWKSVLNSVTVLFFVFVSGFLIWRYFNGIFMDILKSQVILYVIIISIAIAVIFPAFKIATKAYDMFRDSLLFFVSIYPKEMPNEKKIFRSIALISLFFLVLVIFPAFFVFFKLNPLYNLFILLILVIITANMFRSSNLIHGIAKRHEANINKLSVKYRKLLRNKMKLKESQNAETDKH